MRLARLLALLLSVATLGLAAAGCGGGGSDSSASGTKPETWAASVCGALETWANDLKAGSQSLSSDLQSSSDLKAVKEKLVTFLENARTSTETMVADVKAAGPPAVKDGEAIQTDLETGLSEARTSFDHAVTTAKDLKATNPTAFMTGVTNLGQQIQTELQTTAEHFRNIETKYDAGDLDEAMSKEPSCKPFASSG